MMLPTILMKHSLKNISLVYDYQSLICWCSLTNQVNHVLSSHIKAANLLPQFMLAFYPSKSHNKNKSNNYLNQMLLFLDIQL